MGSAHFSEGDYIKTVDGLFFAVKGGRHSDELVVAILRYLPDTKGNREYGGTRYRRVYDLDYTTKYLRENHSEYINHISWLGLELQSVPTASIAKVFKPVERLQRIMENPESMLEKKITRFVSQLSEESGVDPAFFGISGSLLIGLELEGSDIDINIYGESEGRRVYDALRKIRDASNWVKGYDNLSIEPVLSSRWGDTGLDLELFRAIECNKVLHGYVDGIDYFIRLLIEEDETVSRPLETLTITATITDASKSIYTPCSYGIDNIIIEGNSSPPNIVELKSYRGKFTEHVKQGDRVRVRGRLEHVELLGTRFYRLILGQGGDYLLSM